MNRHPPTHTHCEEEVTQKRSRPAPVFVSLSGDTGQDSCSFLHTRCMDRAPLRPDPRAPLPHTLAEDGQSLPRTSGHQEGLALGLLLLQEALALSSHPQRAATPPAEEEDPGRMGLGRPWQECPWGQGSTYTPSSGSYGPGCPRKRFWKFPGSWRKLLMPGLCQSHRCPWTHPLF